MPVVPGAPSRSAAVGAVAAIVARIASAGQAGDKRGQAALYLELARAEVEGAMDPGMPERAAGALRQSIRLAMGEKHSDIHASARLMLGDLAERSGDLTTACEHWQLARSLFQGLSLLRDAENAESRMLNRRCPTDWVLNDF